MSKNAAAELLNSEHSHSHGQKFMALENKDRFFHRFSNIRCRVWFAGAPRASTTPDKHQNPTKMKRPFARCIEIQYSTSVSQLQSEGNLYYRAPFGLNGRAVIFRRDSS
jgi:hypothetical protein